MAAKAKRRSKTKAKSKAKKVAAIPKGFHTVTPYLAITNCAKALAFYTKAFGAKELYRLTDPAGRIGHAEMKIGDSIIMIADEAPQAGALSPKTVGGCPIRLHLSVPDCDAVVARAAKAGAMITRPVKEEFYGMRAGNIMDPFGYSWMISTQVKVVTPKKMQKMWDNIMAGKAP